MWPAKIKVNKEFEERMPKQKRRSSKILEVKWVTLNMVKMQGSRILADSKKEIAKRN